MPGRTRKPNSEIPMGPFADIAFLLIIFFILVTSLTKNLGFTTEIPAGEKSEAKEEKSNSVAIKGDNIFFNDQGMDIQTLQKELQALKLAEMQTDSDKTVMLETSGTVRYGKYFNVMAAISDAGGVVAIVQEE